MLWLSSQALAQDQTPPPQGVSRGENFSAKPPAQLFASDCTGSGCHKGPQGLAKNPGIGIGGLAGFLREHYTNSRESAAALANYLSKIPSGPEPKEARTPRGGKPATAAAPSGGIGGWFETPAASEGRPTPNEARKPPAGHTPPTRASRASVKPEPVKPEEEPVAVPPATSAARHPVAEPAESSPKSDEPAAKPEEAAKPAESPAKPTARAQRGRHPAATAAVPMPPPMPEAAQAPPPAPPPPPAPKEYDIFD
jgi:hypothetical protein